jgi:hypothetical protein
MSVCLAGLPHRQTIPLLHKVMGAQGGGHGAAALQPLLNSCCSTLQPDQLDEALDGLLFEQSSVRAAALASLVHVPCFAEGAIPASVELSTRLFMAMHDADEANAAAAKELWDRYSSATRLSLFHACVSPALADRCTRMERVLCVGEGFERDQQPMRLCEHLGCTG